MSCLRYRSLIRATVTIVPTITTAFVRRRHRSRVMRSCCHFTTCKLSDDISFHLPHRCNLRAYASVAEHKRLIFVGDVASPLSTPIDRKTERGIASPIDRHNDMFSFQTKHCTAKSTRNVEVLKARGGEARPNTSGKTETRSTVDVPGWPKT